jgi:NTP pyrophosphatase (non-canonical NTP hydrolase)
MGRLTTHLKEVVNVTWNFAGRITDKQGHQQNAMIGLASEAGELLDIGKKMWFHTEKPFESFREKILSELGDVLYYWLKVVDLFGFSIKEIVDYNRKKLASRHPELGEVKERFGTGHIKG